MAQILCWDIDYTPTLQPWSTVKCSDRKKVLDYLQPDSIILVSESVWNNREFKKFLILAKLHYPNVQLGIMCSRKKKPTILVSYIKVSEIEDFTRDCMRRHFKLIDHKKMILEAEEELKIKN